MNNFYVHKIKESKMWLNHGKKVERMVHS